MNKLNMTFQTGQVLGASSLNAMSGKIDELVENANQGTHIDVDNEITETSTNPVSSKALYTKFSGIDTSVAEAVEKAEAVNGLAQEAKEKADSANASATEVESMFEEIKRKTGDGTSDIEKIMANTAAITELQMKGVSAGDALSDVASIL